MKVMSQVLSNRLTTGIPVSQSTLSEILKIFKRLEAMSVTVLQCSDPSIQVPEGSSAYKVEPPEISFTRDFVQVTIAYSYGRNDRRSSTIRTGDDPNLPNESLYLEVNGTEQITFVRRDEHHKLVEYLTIIANNGSIFTTKRKRS